MLKQILLACVAAISLACTEGQAGTKPVKTLRIMSYNVRHGVGMDEKLDLKRTADVIAGNNPDIVAVQEVDSATQRSKGLYTLGELARTTQMYPVFSLAITFDGGKYGQGILSKEKPLSYRIVPLPGKEEKRTLLITEFPDFVFCSTHLSLTPADRLASLDIIKKEIGTIQKPVFLAGDLNASPDEAFIQQAKGTFAILTNTKVPTCPADKPKEAIDYIMVAGKDTSDVKALSSWVINEPVASDHRPVIADIAFEQPADRILLTQPYLQNPTHNGMTIMWQTTVPTYSWVEYGTDKNHLQRARTLVDGQVICNGTLNKIRLNNLEKGKTYYYRICSREILLYEAYKKVFGKTAVSDFHSFTLPDDKATDFTALIFNDLHQRPATLKALYKQVANVPADFVVFNGDCIADPKDHDQATAFLKVMMETVGAADKPAFVIRGNHEIRNAFSIGLRSLLDYVDDKPYNAFSWGDTRFVVLDCGEDKPDSTWVYYDLNDFSGFRKEQVGFLKNELQSKAFKQAGKRVLIHHIPLYGLGGPYNPCLEEWGGLLKHAPFNVDINAHTHRFAYHPTGTEGNNFPVVIGGGPEVDRSTVMILQRKAKQLTLKVLNAAGKELLNLSL